MKVKSRAESDMARALPERPHGCLLFCSLSVCWRVDVGLDLVERWLLTRPQASRQTLDGRWRCPWKNGLTGLV
jgi:hypothetical protein